MGRAKNSLDLFSAVLGERRGLSLFQENDLLPREGAFHVSGKIANRRMNLVYWMIREQRKRKEKSIELDVIVKESGIYGPVTDTPNHIAAWWESEYDLSEMIEQGIIRKIDTSSSKCYQVQPKASWSADHKEDYDQWLEGYSY